MVVFPGEARPDPGGRDGAAGLCRQHDGECLPRLRLPHQDLRHGLALRPHQHIPDLHIRPQQVTVFLLLSVINHSFLRFIPLVVVIFRMLMVCHVDFCHKHGEKVIRDQLLRYKISKCKWHSNTCTILPSGSASPWWLETVLWTSFTATT